MLTVKSNRGMETSQRPVTGDIEGDSPWLSDIPSQIIAKPIKVLPASPIKHFVFRLKFKGRLQRRNPKMVAINSRTKSKIALLMLRNAMKLSAIKATPPDIRQCHQEH
jgi:hypothetical protein